MTTTADAVVRIWTLAEQRIAERGEDAVVSARWLVETIAETWTLPPVSEAEADHRRSYEDY